MIDVALTVQYDEKAGTLAYDLDVRNPRLGLVNERYGEVRLSRDPSAFLAELFRIVEESHATGRRLEGVGEKLFRELVPKDLQERLRTLGGKYTVLQIRSDETFVPWELLRIPGSPRGFLAEAFVLTRWLLGSEPTTMLLLKNMALVTARQSGLPHADAEHDFVAALGDDHHRVTEVAATYATVTEALDSGRHDGWHFTGHGYASAAADSSLWSLRLDDGELTSYDVRAALGLVFANACHSSRGGRGITRAGGLSRAFLEAGAGAFVGAYWSVDDAPACDFACAFYERFLGDGLPIGEAVRRARLEIRESFPGNPAWLAYTVFAHPEASNAEPVSESEPPRPPRRIPPRPVPKQEILPPAGRPWLVPALAALAPLFLFVLGLTVHRSRETMLRISPQSYSVTRSLATGAEAVGALFVKSLLAPFTSHAEIKTSAWTLLGLTVLCLAASRRRRWPPAAYVASGLAAVTLGAGVLLYTFALRARHPGEEPADTSALCATDIPPDSASITDRIVFESCTWLVNPTPTNGEWRDSLSGLALYFLLASGAAVWCGLSIERRKGLRHYVRLGLIVVNVVVLLLVLRQLPLAHAYSSWGLTYPPVEIAGSCDDELVEPLEEGLCCAYDVSAGATETVLLIRGTECPVAGERPWDEETCKLRRLPERAVTQGCS